MPRVETSLVLLVPEAEPIVVDERRRRAVVIFGRDEDECIGGVDVRAPTLGVLVLVVP
jgi:hypothetical protein